MSAAPAPASLHLAIVSVDRLLDTAGSPLATPHLHPEAAEALVKLAERAPRGAAVQLEFTVPEPDSHRTDEVRQAQRRGATPAKQDGRWDLLNSAGRCTARVDHTGVRWFPSPVPTNRW